MPQAEKTKINGKRLISLQIKLAQEVRFCRGMTTKNSPRHLIAGVLQLAVLIGSPLFSQPVLHLKTRRFSLPSSGAIEQVNITAPFRAEHFILQFNDPPTADTLAILADRGVAVLQGIPENALLVTIKQPVSVKGLGVRFAGQLAASDKISPLIDAKGLKTWNGYLLAEFHPDVDMNDARSLVLRLGVELVENPDLASHQVLSNVPFDATQPLAPLELLAAQDETSYIFFPASASVVTGTPPSGPVNPKLPKWLKLGREERVPMEP